MSNPCRHGLTHCAYCVEPGTYTLSEQDDLDRPPFPPKPMRSWGGEKTVCVLGKDDKPVLIPPAMQYAWSLKGLETPAARIATWAYARIPKVVKRFGLRQPDSFEREDLAQQVALNFMEYLLTLKEKEGRALVAALAGPIDKENPGAYKLAFVTTRTVRAWNRELSKRPEILPIDELTGLAYGPLERWAEPGTYKPMMKLLIAARDTDPADRTRYQQRLMEVWRIFDPDLTGRITRTEPLNDMERKQLQRIREDVDEQHELPTYSEEEVAEAMAVLGIAA